MGVTMLYRAWLICWRIFIVVWACSHWGCVVMEPHDDDDYLAEQVAFIDYIDLEDNYGRWSPPPKDLDIRDGSGTLRACDDEVQGDSCNYDIWLEADDAIDTGSYYESLYIVSDRIDPPGFPTESSFFYFNISSDQGVCRIDDTLRAHENEYTAYVLRVICFYPEEDVTVTIALCGCVDGQRDRVDMNIDIDFYEMG